MPSSIPSSTALEKAECPTCGRDSTDIVYALPGDESGPRTVVRCPECHLLYVSPRIPSSQISEKYLGKNYFERQESSTGYQDYLSDRELHLIFFRRQLARLEELAPRKGRLLDVGCAGGFLVEEAGKKGWQAQGVELSSYASGYARDVLGLDVITNSLGGAAFPSSHFQAMVMDDVIEHFENPLVDLQEAWRVLAPGGILMIHTPNAASPWRHLMGKKWIHLKPDEHLFYFDPHSIDRLLQKAGFEVIEARACSKATNLQYIAGVAGKLLPGLTGLLNGIFGKSGFWTRPFPFRGGGMQVCARKLEKNT